MPLLNAQAGKPIAPSAVGQGPVLDRPDVGRVKRRVLRVYPDLVYYLYVPSRIRQPERLFVSVHGISRNARQHAEMFSRHAEREGVVLLAPLFDRFGFPGYQRLAANADNLRPDQALDMIIDEVRDLLGLPAVKLNLFGYSGGGQFAHRYLMAYPHKVENAVVGAAGWYTFPSQKVPFPRGIGAETGQHWQPGFPGFLQVPVTVVVGENDVYRDDALNKSSRIDRQQGSSRFERGRRWVRAMARQASKRGYLTNYRFVSMPGVGHDFEDAMQQGGLGPLVFTRLFGEDVRRKTCAECTEIATAATDAVVVPLTRR